MIAICKYEPKTSIIINIFIFQFLFSNKNILTFNFCRIINITMGNYKVVNKHVDNTKLPRLQPEPNYDVKTRPPITEGNSWKINLNLRIREEQLSDQAMPLARRKCYDPIMQFANCRIDEGFFWYVFNCQEEFNDVAVCLEHEYNVEMDRRRRDINRNPQPWWRQYYDQDGEVGRQAQFKDQHYGVIDSIRWTLFGTQRDKKFQI